MQSYSAKKIEILLKELENCEIMDHQGSFSLSPQDQITIARKAQDAAKLGDDAIVSALNNRSRFNYTQRFFVLQLLRHIQNDQALDFIIDQAEDNDSLIRALATDALSFYNDKNAIDLLKSLTHDENCAVRQNAIAGLRSIEETVSLSTIEHAITDEDAEVRREAVKVISDIPGVETTNLLLEILADPQMGVAYEAKSALQKRLAQHELLPNLIQALGRKGRYTKQIAVELMAKTKDARMIEPLMQHLEICDNKALRQQIITVLSKTRQPQVLPALRNGLYDKDKEVVAASLEGFKRIRSEKGFEYLREFCLSDASLSLPTLGEEELLSALLASKSANEEPFLKDLLLHENSNIAIEAAKALQAKNITVDKAYLKDRLLNAELHFERKYLLEAFNSILPKGEKLDIEIADKDKRPKESKDNGLVQLNRDELDTLSDEDALQYLAKLITLDSYDTTTAINRLKSIPGKQSILLLRGLLKHKDIYARAYTVKALISSGYTGLTDEDKAAMYLVERRYEELRLLNDKAHSVIEMLATHPNRQLMQVEPLKIYWEANFPDRIEVAISFISGYYGERTDKTAFSLLKGAKEEAEEKVFKTFNECESSGIRIETAKLLGHYKTKAATECLVSSFQKDAYMLAACAEALGKINDQRAINPLIEAIAWAEEGPPLNQLMDALVKLKAKEAVKPLQNREIKRPKVQEKRDKVVAKLMAQK